MTTALIELDENRRNDAGSAINEAMAALPSYGGKILIAGGDWTIDTPILINKNSIILEGLGKATSLWFDGSVVPTAIQKHPDILRITDIQIIGMGIYTTVDGSGTGIDGTKFTRSVFRGLYVGVMGKAFSRGMSFNSDMTYYNSIENCSISAACPNNVSSRCLEFQNNANSNQVDNLRIFGNDKTTGVYVNSHSIQLNRVDGEATMYIGIHVGSSAHGCDIISPYFESITHGIYISPGVHNVNIFGGTLERNRPYNVRDMGAVKRTTTGVWFTA